MNPHRYAWGAAYDFSFAAVIAGATLVGTMFSRDPKRVPWTGLTVVWVLWIVWMCVTTLFALVPDVAIPEWDRAMKIQLMAFVTLIVVNTRERLHALVWAIAAALGFFGIKGGLFTIATGGENMVWGPPDSFISGNNSLALALVMAFPLMRYLQLNTEQRWIRLGLSAVMALTVLSVLASYSRGAFLAILAMGGFLLLKSRKKGAILVVLLIALPATLAIFPEKWFERIETIAEYDQDASALGRINAWWFAYNVASERPVVGGGYGAFNPDLFTRYAPVPDDYHDAHSIYFEVLGEHGFTGLALFLLLGWLSFRSASGTMSRARDRPDLRWAYDLAAMVQVAIIGYAVGGAFLGLAYFDLYYHLVAIALLTRMLVERAPISSAAAPSPPWKARTQVLSSRTGDAR